MNEDETFETHCEIAKKRFLEDKELMPTFFAYDQDGKVLLLPLVMTGKDFEETQKSKYQILNVFKFIFHCEKVKAYVFAHEAWYLVQQESEVPNNIKGSFEHLENRKEGLVIGYISHNKRAMQVYEITRDGDKIGLKEASPFNDNVAGEFASLLPVKDAIVTDKEKWMYELLKKGLPNYDINNGN